MPRPSTRKATSAKAIAKAAPSIEEVLAQDEFFVGAVEKAMHKATGITKVVNTVAAHNELDQAAIAQLASDEVFIDNVARALEISERITTEQRAKAAQTDQAKAA
jgi:hypothetical protein